jgi:hypothetical protein
VGFKVPQRPPAPIRIGLRVDWSAPVSPSLVLAHYAKLFRPEDPVDMVLLVGDACESQADAGLSRLLEVSGVDPSRSAPVRLVREATGHGTNWSAVASHPVDDPRVFDATLEIMKLHRRRLDGYQGLEARRCLQEAMVGNAEAQRRLAELQGRMDGCEQELARFRARRLVRLVDGTWVGAAARAVRR